MIELMPKVPVNNISVLYVLLQKRGRENGRIRVSNSLDPDQDQHFVDPDLCPNCLQRLSADNKSPLARKKLNMYPDYLS